MAMFAVGLTLTEILYGAEHVLCNGFLVLDDLLDNNGLGETLIDSLGHDGLSGSVKKLLFAVAESMSLHVTGGIRNPRVGLPVVVASALLSRSEVTMSTLVHLGSFASLLHRSTLWVKDILGIHAVASCDTVRVLVATILHLLRPVVSSLIANTKRLSHCGCVLALFSIVEFICESIQILSFNHHIDGVSTVSLASESVLQGQSWLTFLQTRVYHDLSWLHVVGLTVLSGVRGSSEVTTNFVSVHLCSDGHVGVVATSRDDVTSCANLGDGVRTDLGGGNGCSLRRD